jgi:elongator complex protein 3
VIYLTVRKYSLELADYILESEPSEKELNTKKITLCKKYSLDKLPLNSTILENLPEDYAKKLKKYLKIKAVRGLAGVNVVAVMSKPWPCPHGKCDYCPGGVEFDVPQSYTGIEPAAMRAIRNNFDPKKQVTNRINQLELVGHDVSKIEMIIMGGTFNSMPSEYQRSFVKNIYDAVANTNSKDLEEAKKIAETSKRRVVGLTVETRPDWCKEENIKNMLELGTTRLELGVQSLDSDILEKVNRGHSVKETIKATQLLKDSALKVLYHIMPGLYSNVDEDIKMYSKLFDNDEYKPDMLKIYPTLIIKNTKFYDLWKAGNYQPYTNEDLEKFLLNFLPKVPYWVRIMRVQRDIPSSNIIAGPNKSNMRDIVITKLKKRDEKIKEIRFREVGFNTKKAIKEYDIFVEEYKASKGREFFISYETKDREVLFGFIRLRFPYAPFIDEIKESALVRELHVYGQVVPIGIKSHIIGQHQGIGTKLLAKAEEIAKENSFKKISVISGIGVREFFYKRGYFSDNYYVSKHL